MGLFGSKPDIDRLKLTADFKGLVQALGNRDPTIRERAAEALGNLRDDRATDPLARALGDRDEIVRGRVIEALARLGGPVARKALTRAMGDEFIGNRERAREAIARMIQQQDEAKVFGLDPLEQKEEPPPFEPLRERDGR